MHITSLQVGLAIRGLKKEYTELAKAAAVHRQTVYRVAKGESVRETTLAKLVEALRRDDGVEFVRVGGKVGFVVPENQDQD